VRILIVEDSDFLATILRNELARRGNDVSVCRLDGTWDPPGWIPDVVLLDIHLGVLSGWDVLAIIRGVAPEVRVIVMSGADEPDLKEQAEAHGAEGWLTKPFDLDDLAKRLEG
jgi:two-component system OmpR family response regulator